ncbi:acyltransferase family protein [Cellulomonas edaphi]|uniref:Acyltransferase family protein n=1 Tax=Cellulomonas edaphi TaxID=3053468 RepID=A0ABT7S588_9CELL|nr:acyltransferase family protein [Cellulomons edaphi]MDM7830679.1 acyltransferase family protein [Cellulomons edaphi]
MSVTTSPSPLRAPELTRAVRPEIQALRAGAVLLVLAFHVAPQGLPGGYIGVDVFFVISGYLITAHIARPLRAGTFTFGGFYARRAVRLLPAAMLVLLVTLVGTWLFVPRTLWPTFGEQISASAVYVENWVLAGNATNYSAPAAGVSPVQHFWSLSAEEQFYLAWPALLVLGQLIAVRVRRWRRAYLLVLGPLALASLAWSVYATAHEPASAYFATTTRAWEFAAGGLLWLVVHRLEVLPDRLLAAASWAGILLIGYAAFTFDAATPFPGWLAILPVLGTCLIIAARSPRARWSPSALMAWRPVQSTGDMSYALYLWHWPLIVLLPYAAGASLGLRGRALAVLVAVPLAYVTRRFVEVPVLAAYRPTGGSFWRRKSTVALAVVSAIAVVAVPAHAMNVRVEQEKADAWVALDAALAAPGPCFGAAAMAPGSGCAEPAAADPTAGVLPDPVIAESDDFGIEHAGCQIRGQVTAAVTCTFGAPGGTPVAIVGDSHAAQWTPALAKVASERGWQLTTYLRSGCPLSATPPAGGGATKQACAVWQGNVLDAVERGGYHYVFTSALSSTQYRGGDAVGGFVDAWQRIGASGAKVVVLRDNPDPTAAGIEATPVCVAERGAAACATAERTTLRPDPLVTAAQASPEVGVVDLTASFCASGTCPAVIGGVLVYHLNQHVTMTYMETLVPALDAAIESTLAAS